MLYGAAFSTVTAPLIFVLNILYIIVTLSSCILNTMSLVSNHYLQEQISNNYRDIFFFFLTYYLHYIYIYIYMCVCVCVCVCDAIILK